MRGDGAILLALVAGGCGATDLIDSHRLGRLSTSWTIMGNAALPPAALCCTSDNIADERLGVMRNQKDHDTELDELCVTQPFDWRGAFHTVSLPPELFQLTPWLGGSLYVMNKPYYPILFRAGPQE